MIKTSAVYKYILSWSISVILQKYYVCQKAFKEIFLNSDLTKIHYCRILIKFDLIKQNKFRGQQGVQYKTTKYHNTYTSITSDTKIKKKYFSSDKK